MKNIFSNILSNSVFDFFTPKKLKKERELKRLLQKELNIEKANINYNSPIDDLYLNSKPLSSSSTNLLDFISKIAQSLKFSYLEKIEIPRDYIFSKSDKEIRDFCNSDYIIIQGSLNISLLISPYPFKLIKIQSLLSKKNKDKDFEIALVSENEFKKCHSKISSLRGFIENESFSDKKWRTAFLMCFLDAFELSLNESHKDSLSSGEIFFGMPELNSYEYTMCKKKYTGVIDPIVREKGLEMLDNKNLLRLQDYKLLGLEIEFAKTKYRNNEIFVCRWGSFTNKLSVSDISTYTKKERKTKPHILIIDDDMRFAEILKRGITAKGFLVSIAMSVNDALLYHLDTSDDIDLIVTDYHMPGKKGSDLIEIIRAKKGDLPIIVLTSDTSKDTQVDMLTLGCDAVVTKDDDPRILLAWIFRLLERQFKVNERLTLVDLKAGMGGFYVIVP